MFEKIAVLGVGLIGASFAKAVRRNGLCKEVAGYGRRIENLHRARAEGIIDSFDLHPENVCRDADLIILCTPVGTFLDLTRRCVPSFKKGALVTDAGSVKGALVHAIEQLMPDGVHYVGGHPIAGSDRSGIGASDEGLFRNSKCIVTPTPHTDPEALKALTGLWESLGSRVVTMEPERHDVIYASVSHFPHLLAYALVNVVDETDPSYLQYSGQGFRDMTRIAASSQEIWRDICLLNRENLVELISLFQNKLDTLGRYLRASDSGSLEREFLKARTLREGIGQN